MLVNKTKFERNSSIKPGFLQRITISISTRKTDKFVLLVLVLMLIL